MEDPNLEHAYMYDVFEIENYDLWKRTWKYFKQKFLHDWGHQVSSGHFQTHITKYWKSHEKPSRKD